MFYDKHAKMLTGQNVIIRVVKELSFGVYCRGAYSRLGVNNPSLVIIIITAEIFLLIFVYNRLNMLILSIF